jgi:hypothetical protein
MKMATELILLGLLVYPWGVREDEHGPHRQTTSGGPCTDSVVSSRWRRGATGRPWNWPVRSAPPGTRRDWRCWSG